MIRYVKNFMPWLIHVYRTRKLTALAKQSKLTLRKLSLKEYTALKEEYNKFIDSAISQARRRAKARADNYSKLLRDFDNN